MDLIKEILRKESMQGVNPEELRQSQAEPKEEAKPELESALKAERERRAAKAQAQTEAAAAAAAAAARGKRGKLKKAKEKYAHQDEEDRQLAIEILAPAGDSWPCPKAEGRFLLH